MAAGTIKVFNKGKKQLGRAAINLSAGPFRLTLHTSASVLKTSASALPRGVYASILAGEVASATGYPSSGKTLATPTWTTTSAKLWKFDAADNIFTATVSQIANIKYAAVWLSAAATAGRYLLCYVTLTTTQFTLAVGNTLTIQWPAGGLFTLL
jgi:hypothetical protein